MRIARNCTSKWVIGRDFDTTITSSQVEKHFMCQFLFTDLVTVRNIFEWTEKSFKLYEWYYL